MKRKVVKKEMYRCKACGKPLTDKTHVTLGYGPTCYKKLLEENRKNVLDVILNNTEGESK